MGVGAQASNPHFKQAETPPYRKTQGQEGAGGQVASLSLLQGQAQEFKGVSAPFGQGRGCSAHHRAWFRQARGCTRRGHPRRSSPSICTPHPMPLCACVPQCPVFFIQGLGVSLL